MAVTLLIFLSGTSWPSSSSRGANGKTDDDALDNDDDGADDYDDADDDDDVDDDDGDTLRHQNGGAGNIIIQRQKQKAMHRGVDAMGWPF